MNETFRCGDQEALVAYLYDECDPAERETIAAHVARCASCAEEIASLQSTRSVLATWTPPDAALGFRITRADAEPGANVVPFGRQSADREASWWRQPLPAWAQVAAALLIFVAGMTFGSARNQAVATAPAAQAPVGAAHGGPVTAPVAARASEVSRDDLARVEERLRAIEAQSRSGQRVASAAAPAIADERAVFERVAAMIAASEDRQRRESITLVADVARDFETQRRVDLRQVEDRLARIQGTTGLELQQQRDALNYFVRTSLTGAR